MDQPWVLIVLVGLVLIVYARISPKAKSGSSSSGVMLNEIEETMEHFAAELEEQNQALIGMFAETKKEYAIHTAKLTTRIEALEKQNQHQQQELAKLIYALDQLPKQSEKIKPESVTYARPSGAQQTHTAVVSDVPASVDHSAAAAPMTESIKERYGTLFEMYGQGKSIEMIAKKLGMNKGEVNLIIQLAKQEEKANA